MADIKDKRKQIEFKVVQTMNLMDSEFIRVNHIYTKEIS